MRFRVIVPATSARQQPERKVRTPANTVPQETAGDIGQTGIAR